MVDSVQRDARGPLVLVVDDDSHIRTYIKAILQPAGVEVLEAGDGVEALEVFYARKNSIDLVITDIRMPRMSGPDLAHSLRSHFPAIPMIFMSGEADPVAPMDSNNGVLIEKPFGPKVLLEAASPFLNSSVNV